MIGQLEECIKAQDYDSAIGVIPELKSLFHEQREIVNTLDVLKVMLGDRDPSCHKKLDDLKHLVVG